MPDGALADMMEWGPANTPAEQLDRMLSNCMSPLNLIARAPDTPTLQDDRPVNEYYLLRELFPPKR